jgi:AFG3 family protein
MFEDRPYSDATAKAMDEEAKSIVDAAYLRTLNLLREKKEEVEKVASLLLEKETIKHDDLVNLIGERPFKADPAYNEFIRRKVRKTAGHEENGEEGVADDEQEGKKDDVDPSALLSPVS